MRIKPKYNPRWQLRRFRRFRRFLKKQRWLGVKITWEQVRICWACAAIDLALDKYLAQRGKEPPTYWQRVYRWVE